MPEYLPPGVYVDQSRPLRTPIPGADKSTAGFVGPTCSGSSDRASDPLASLIEYEQEFGGGAELRFADGARIPNYMWHAARAYFANGGKRLHVAVAQPIKAAAAPSVRPRAADYVAALQHLERLRDISIVAAPGATFACDRGYGAEADAIIKALLAHAERMRRFAVVDSGDAQSASDARAMRARFDSPHGALYYPWITTVDPVSHRDLHLPPSGFVAGIYARVDAARGVHKPAANEVVTLATGLERDITREQEIPNVEHINCFRTFPDRGIVIWGNRTLSSDPEWKYVNVRRYLLYLETSIDRGTQWAVFEPNGESVWEAVRRCIENFLIHEWKTGALVGNKPQEAFFVRCDRTTMTQNDIDNGRLVCMIGVAPVRPAEFIIFRIGKWTARRR